MAKCFPEKCWNEQVCQGVKHFERSYGLDAALCKKVPLSARLQYTAPALILWLNPDTGNDIIKQNSNRIILLADVNLGHSLTIITHAVILRPVMSTVTGDIC